MTICTTEKEPHSLKPLYEVLSKLYWVGNLHCTEVVIQIKDNSLLIEVTYFLFLFCHEKQ